MWHQHFLPFHRLRPGHIFCVACPLTSVFMDADADWESGFIHRVLLKFLVVSLLLDPCLNQKLFWQRHLADGPKALTCAPRSLHSWISWHKHIQQLI